MLARARTRHVVAVGPYWLVATIYEAGAFGYSFEKAEQAGYKRELDAAIKGLREMHSRGITVLPGGDYGFAWTPHGAYARDLEQFVELLGSSPMESIVAATAGVARLFMREHELGRIRPGFLADCILVDGDPLDKIAILQDHSKLDVIMINGRVRKADHNEFVRHEQQPNSMDLNKELNNFISYRLDDGTGRTRVGHLDNKSQAVTPLAFESGTPVEDLYQLIEAGEKHVIAGGQSFALTDSVQILAPLRGRDILAIGKNYSEHAKEFNASGFDSSDKNDMPSHPVVFTKRSTSIIAHGEDILLHEGFTSTLDYEGEIGVIIGKYAFEVPEMDADQYIWGYTIINDVTAREKQRDHKQFYIGKSADSYCPMGPVAVPKAALPRSLTVTTQVNGEHRQNGSIDDLIFSVPRLIATLSESQTLRPGDVIATGTPFGVGFGLKPPVFLKPGDTVEVSITGLGTLRNKVAASDANNHVTRRVQQESVIPINNLAITNGGLGLTLLTSGKRLNTKKIGQGPEVIVFVHGLGGSMAFFSPVLNRLGLHKADNSQYTSVLLDLEGQGLSPTKATSKITISSYAQDTCDILETLCISVQNGITVVAHSMGCLVACQLASQNPGLVKRLVLLGPPPTPLPSAAAEACIQRAATVRAEGLRGVAVAVAAGGTSAKTQSDRPLSLTAVQMSLLSQDPEGYAKGCTALAGARDLDIDVSRLSGETSVLLVTGAEDKVSPPAHVRKLAEKMKNAKALVLPDVGHWHVFEDVEAVVEAIKDFLV